MSWSNYAGRIKKQKAESRGNSRFRVERFRDEYIPRPKSASFREEPFYEPEPMPEPSKPPS
jgi:hypothetical protein